MKYSISTFSSAVAYYKKALQAIGSRNMFVHGRISSRAFYSIAPLSRAAHELGKEIYVYFYESDGVLAGVLSDVWAEYLKYLDGKSPELKELFEAIGSREIEAVFEKPGIVLEAGMNRFAGTIDLDYRDEWAVPYRWEELVKTGEILARSCYDLKKEKLSIGFEVMPEDSFLDNPVEDYLDAYAIAYAFYTAARKLTPDIVLSSATAKESMLDPPEMVSELSTTLTGMELEKDIDEPVFRIYKRLSQKLNLSRLRVNDAVFAVRGKGYHGRHFFGEKFGYPTLNRKSRWDSPGGIIYKFAWYPQALEEDRDPLCRIGFTETVPIDIFIDSVNIDYDAVRKKNRRIADIIRSSKKIIVESRESGFEVGLIKKDGTRRTVDESDSDVRFKIDPPVLKERGLRTGMMANIPGGETYLTPEYVKGRIIGDVVISVDKSYMLSEKEPLVIEADGDRYRIVSGPSEIVDKINSKKKDAWDRLLIQEKNHSLPQDLIELKKSNFERIGEFAINTNPNARLCEYLIVNEKIANMIHVALGSGYEPDRSSEYHMDIVINAPRQKLSIYGVDEKGGKRYILREGVFAV